jgi:hypothetical protein
VEPRRVQRPTAWCPTHGPGRRCRPSPRSPKVLKNVLERGFDLLTYRSRQRDLREAPSGVAAAFTTSAATDAWQRGVAGASSPNSRAAVPGLSDSDVPPTIRARRHLTLASIGARAATRSSLTTTWTAKVHLPNATSRQPIALLVAAYLRGQ